MTWHTSFVKQYHIYHPSSLLLLRIIQKQTGERRETEMPPTVIIALKGYPCTGKTKLAVSLSKALECALIHHETVFNCMAKFQDPQPTTLSVSTIVEKAEHLNNVSFEAVCRMALTLLRSKRPVIIDTSLSQRSHLDRLLEVSNSTRTRLIIIECIVLHKYEWKNQIERKQSEAAAEATDGSVIVGWYKLRTWYDLEKLLERYDWCAHDEEYIGNLAGFSKLVVSTSSCNRAGEVVIMKKNVQDSSEHTHLSDVLDWICEESWRPLETGSSSEKLQGQVEDGNVGSGGETLRHIIKRIGHPLGAHLHNLRLSKEKIDGEIACRKCLQLITTPVPEYYSCVDCDLSLHKSCAELSNNHSNELKPHELGQLVDPKTGKYSFPEKHSCPFHSHAEEEGDGEGMGFVDDCADCLFHTSLRWGLFPVVLHHRLHKMYFYIIPVASDTEFLCDACGETSKEEVYYLCRGCKIQFHVGCALLPFCFKHEIHRHPLHLTFLNEDDGTDEYYCDVCEDNRNPSHMMYYCEECNFTCHLSCMTFPQEE
ncbi:hypothetical protein LOK49_LG08G03402 [Camellia lanceoleosa]|uniref:Uncharacterized protein n=1 Tax=Camellia lanceoleosa TaxID=1840588 RepID=A0ACC0GR16_9ERIC|nr:hypothetical protein LOK49_LG08G03402 [Camellia lanceoleosa]